MKPVLVIRGAALILEDAYTATLPVRVGDSLKVTGEWKVAPTQDATDDVLGVAANSANAGQPVGVVVAGLVKTITTSAVQRGDFLTPAQGGLGVPSRGVLPAGARRHAVAVESQDAGKPVWVQLRA